MTHSQVAQRWAEGKQGTGSRMSTDGETIKSYWHTIGTTEPGGRKVAIDCHYSQSTAQHCGYAIEAAGEFKACPDHSYHPKGCRLTRKEAA